MIHNSNHHLMQVARFVGAGLALLIATPPSTATYFYTSVDRTVAYTFGGITEHETGRFERWVGHWDIPNRATQGSYLYSGDLHGGGFAIAQGYPEHDYGSSSVMDTVFTSDVAQPFQFLVRGTGFTEVRLWSVDAAQRSETLVAAAVLYGGPSTVSGQIEAGVTYHLRAQAYVIDEWGGSPWGEWAVGFPEIPAPGGAALAAVGAMLALRRRRG